MKLLYRFAGTVIHNFMILKGLSHEMDLDFDDVWLVLGLNRGRGYCYIFFGCSNDFILQKVYFSRLMRLYVRLIMVSCLFLSFLLITIGV